MSIGIAFSGQGTSRDDLLQNADMAMYRAKERGRGGQFTFFDVDRMGVSSLNRLDLDTSLHHVVDRGEIEVHYQPLVSLVDRRIVGAEALVRWNHPDHGVLLPAHFVKLAEDNGTIVPIDGLVIEQACRQAQTWQKEFGVTLQIGVNVSARQFQRTRLADEVAGVLQATGLDPGRLCLEVTEGLAMEDIDLTSSVLTALHDLGVQGGHRRLRDRPLVPQLVGPLPDRRAEDRPRASSVASSTTPSRPPSSRRWWHCRGPSARRPWWRGWRPCRSCRRWSVSGATWRRATTSRGPSRRPPSAPC